jgi:exopolysaccharide biosynthesis polyprenyl glycosylphosphotransferase
MFQNLKKVILIGGDLVFLFLALWATLLIRYPENEINNNFNSHLPHFLVVFFIFILIFYINGLYSLNLKMRGRKFFLNVINSILASSALSIIYFYLNVQSNIAPKTNLAIFIGVYSFLFLIWRAIYQSLVYSVIPQSNLAIIGFNQYTENILKELRSKPGTGYQAALIIKSAEELEGLANSIKEKNIKTIVVCDYFGQNEKMSDVLFNCLSYSINFFNYPDFYELLSGKIPVEAIGPEWFLENLKEGEKNYFNFLKRLFDIILGLIIFIVSLPFWPLIAIIIKLESRGPVFFRQARLGLHEKEFQIFKFRSMKEDNNDRSLTQEKDNRITKFGNFLRKTRLDEIPQVINIIRNEMSFIGPRPERPEIVSELEKQIPYYKTRLLIKPGLTGWDQVSGEYHSATSEDTLEKLQYDLFYLKQRSLYLDLDITLRTIATMISRGGR